MAESSIEIVRCPPEHFAEAMALVLREVRADHRQEVVHGPAGGRQPQGEIDESLFIALRADQLCGAAWGQLQPGHTAVLWPPQLQPGDEADTAVRLIRAVVAVLDMAGVDLTQVLLPGRDREMEALLRPVAFAYLTDLLYLCCEASLFPRELPDAGGLEFDSYHESQRPRLAALIERTYVDTRDCPQLNDARRIDDVIDGYQANGDFRAEHWLLARAGEQDVGVLLVADHPLARQIELTYMGIVPEGRGRGWGGALTRRALWLARCAKVERVMLAVDAANDRALAIYRQAGFAAWDRRAVFVRFRGESGK